MKKLLALVLALVMTMSLVTISNAAFKDANSIDYKEAVEVMNKVGVLIGDEKGNFNAKDTLTRGQAAKIVAYLDLGGKTADAIKVSGAVFTDVKATDWFAGYVEYCAGAGYVAGMGDKTFAPNEKVTGVQFAKMLLCALGYKAEVEGYTGSDYTVLQKEDDAAYADLGGKFRMPTRAEIKELLATKDNRTDYTWVKCDGEFEKYQDSTVKGWKVIKNVSGATIFFPCAGGMADFRLVSAGSIGKYWSSSLYVDAPYCAWGVDFYYNENIGDFDECGAERCIGRSVRPVSD